MSAMRPFQPVIANPAIPESSRQTGHAIFRLGRKSDRPGNQLTGYRHAAALLAMLRHPRET
jgi:hypothetical protein